MTTEAQQYDQAAAEAFAAEAQSANVLAALGPTLIMEFNKATIDRRQTEDRWLKDLRQYKGQYDPEVLKLIGKNRSKSFVRKTRVKVKTANSRVEDLLFPSGSEKNWEVTNTPVPSVSDEVRKGMAQMLAQQAQAQAAQNPPQPGQQAQPVVITKEAIDKAVLELCKQAAKNMSKVIDDQLSEVRYKQICKAVIHSAHLYGTGVLKGPLVERRVRSKFVQIGKNKWQEKSEAYVVPFIDYVPLWRFYPDMGADSLDKCRFVYERHQMTHAALGELANRKSFNKAAIKSYLLSHPQGEVFATYVDNQLKIIGERDTKQGDADGKYEVLERWGWLTGQQLHEAGLKIEQDRLHESFFSNVWLMPNGTIIKAVLQPINGVTWPYHIYYFDKDETSIFGEGLATVMSDDQTMLNAATRLMLDNAAITSGPMLEVAVGLLSRNDDGEAQPWKVFYRNSQQPGVPAVRAIDLNSKLGDLSGLANRFENNVDEVSAIPRYMTGENVTTGAAGTASGMSMLMGASNIMIKDLISSWDEGVTRSFFSALYRWNMQFNPDNSIKGDFDVKARGTASLVAREVRAQQLDNFAAMTNNPLDAPFIKRQALLRQRAEANELSDVVKTEEEVAAEQNNPMAAMQIQLQQAQQQLAMSELKSKVDLLTAQASKAMAEVDLLKAKIVDTKVGSVYAALQAGGTATASPHIAPAGDEILRSSGWQDATPDPSIAQLMTLPDGQPQGAQDQGGMPQGTQYPATGNPPAPQGSGMDSAKPQTGHVGQDAGIETAAA